MYGISETLNIEVRTPHRLKNNKEEEIFLKKINPSLIIVVSYGQLIPKNLLEIPKNGFINVHASLLPKWRGAAPIQRAIMNLDGKTGISIIKLNENLDDYGAQTKRIKLPTAKDLRFKPGKWKTMEEHSAWKKALQSKKKK